MHGMEIYESLMQLTQVKQRILQQLQLITTNNPPKQFLQGQKEKEQQMISDLKWQQKELRQKEQARQQNQRALIEALQTLRKQEKLIRQMKNKRVQERLELLGERKQLQARLQQLRSEQESIRQPTNKPSLAPPQECIGKPIEEAKDLCRTRASRQKQLQELDLEIRDGQLEVGKASRGLEKLQQSIVSKRTHLGQLRGRLDHLEQQILILQTEGNKMAKELMRNNSGRCHRNLVEKVDGQSKMGSKIYQMCQLYAVAAQQYAQVLQLTRTQLRL